MRRLLLIGITISALASSAQALTVRDLIELTRAGLGDEVLLALIEVDRGVYAIDTATLKQLKAAGVSDRVIAALVRSGREMRMEEPAQTTEPQVTEASAPPVIVIDHHEVERVREVPVAVAVPIYVPVAPRYRHRSVSYAPDVSTFVPFQSGPSVTYPIQPVQPQKVEPVYWGWGGKLRPDAWQPDVKPPDRRK